MGADRIIAEPGTITGSIGVYSGKFVTTGLWDKLGVTNKTIALGDPSLYSSQMDYSEAARAKLEGSLDRIYNDFVGKAAKGRHMTFAELEPLAHGRIWSGSDALEKHLVDALGGYETALNVTRELLALPAGAPLRIREYPRPKSTLERLKAFTGSDGDNSDEQQAAMRARVVDVATAGLSRAAVLLDEPQSLSMPMFDVPTVSGSQP
jgi:protease-4